MTLRAQIGHVYLMKFTQAVWLLSSWWKGMNETNLTQHCRSTDVNAFDILHPRDTKKFSMKKMKFIKNDVILWQFMLCKNINQYNNGLCKSSSDYKCTEIWIGKLMRGRISTLTIKYRTYLDSNSEHLIAVYSEAAKFRIRISSLYLF